MIQNCQQCGEISSGNFCSNCGQSLTTKRLTISAIIHEVFHFFTHLDKGFPYTLKKLAIMPGKMQKEYIDGHRSRYQKPFSMVFICGTLTAFALYLIHKPTASISHFDEVKTDFTRHYYVLVQLGLLPFYALVTWILFKNNKINYAESLVLFAYTLSFMLLIVILTNLIDLLPDKSILSSYYEIPVLFAYLLWTNINFFRIEPKWRLIVKTIVHIFIVYYASNFLSDFIVNLLL
jgi:Protein of unknown function (DUF3667)